MSFEEKDIDQLFKEGLYGASSSYEPTKKEQVLDLVQASRGRTSFFIILLTLFFGAYIFLMEWMSNKEGTKQAAECTNELLNAGQEVVHSARYDHFSDTLDFNEASMPISAMKLMTAPDFIGRSEVSVIVEEKTILEQGLSEEVLLEETMNEENVDFINKRSLMLEHFPMKNYSFIQACDSRWSMRGSIFVGMTNVKTAGALREGDLLRTNSESSGWEFGGVFTAERSFGSSSVYAGLGFSNQRIDNDYGDISRPVIVTRDTMIYDFFWYEELVLDSVFEQGQWNYFTVSIPVLDSTLVNTTVSDTVSDELNFLKEVSTSWRFNSVFVPIGFSKRVAGFGALTAHVTGGVEFHYMVARRGSYVNVDGTGLVMAAEDQAIRRLFVTAQLGIEGRWGLKNGWYFVAAPSYHLGLNSFYRRFDYNLQSLRFSLGVGKRLGSRPKP